MVALDVNLFVDSFLCLQEVVSGVSSGVVVFIVFLSFSRAADDSEAD